MEVLLRCCRNPGQRVASRSDGPRRKKCEQRCIEWSEVLVAPEGNAQSKPRLEIECCIEVRSGSEVMSEVGVAMGILP